MAILDPNNIPEVKTTYINLEYIFYKIYEFFFGTGGVNASVAFDSFLKGVKTFFSILAVFLIAIILYCLIRIHEIRKEEKKKLKTREIIDIEPKPMKNEKWAQVEEHAASNNPSDWRLAIIEADTMLDDLLKTLLPHGENLGERLKAMEPSDFPKLQQAWEAHKVRNRIAHEGSDFNLSRPEARRIINLYEEVFHDTHYI
ncbi:MAG: hypothetical protein WC795_03420 [Candidatus Paceibacterota bacterium]|jgi:hypothetical protein